MASAAAGQPAVGPLGGPLEAAATPAATATSALPGYTARVEPLPGTGTVSAGPVVIPQPTAAPESQGILGTVKDFYSEYVSPSRPGITEDSGLIAKYGPLAALGTAGLYAGGFFKRPEVDQPEPLPTGAELLAQDPSRYRLSSDAFVPTRAAGSYYVPTKYYEDGGEVFPRRNGGIMPNEGIPNEDSVRAMLMPGEFVMTTDAVRGAGNGNLNRGISNMYSMMRNLENKNDRMA